MTFAAAAARAAGVATGLLGWSPDVFWRATPADLTLALRARVGGEADTVRAADAALLAKLVEDNPDG